MGSVNQQSDLAAWIDDSLDYLEREWKQIPVIAAEWDDWDEPDRLDLVIEWPLRTDRLHMLERWCAEGRLSPDQRQRFQKLQEVMDRNRPTLERFLED